MRSIPWARLTVATLLIVLTLGSCELLNDLLDGTPPDAVTALTATYTGHRSITLTWTRTFSEDVKQVEVTYTPGGTEPVVLSVDTENAVIDGIAFDTLYDITVTVVDEADNTSPESVQLEVSSVVYSEDFESGAWNDSPWVVTGTPSQHDGVLELANPTGIRWADPLGVDDDLLIRIRMRSTDSDAGGSLQAVAAELLEPSGLYYLEAGYVNTSSELFGGIGWDGDGALYQADGAHFLGGLRADTTFNDFEISWDTTELVITRDVTELARSDLADLRGTYWDSVFITGTDVPDPATGFILLLNHYSTDNTEIDSIEILRQ